MRPAAFMMVALANPSVVGAVLPSSRYLAAAMAEAADGAQMLGELGAGTGAMTAALRARFPTRPLVAVEMQVPLARQLRERFDDIEVHAAPAHEVLEALGDAPPATVLVSSLPFRSLPDLWREPTIAAIERFLLAHPERRLVQFTYQPRAPFELQNPGTLRWTRLLTVWRNVPPAGVWQLRRA